MHYNIQEPDPHECERMRRRMNRIQNRKILPKGTFIGKYEIEACIGRGGFGDIYGVKIPGDSKIYAIKIEDRYNDKNKKKKLKRLSLFKEIQYVKELQDSLDIARYVDSGATDKYLYIVMELLGPSLSNTRREVSHQKFSLSTTLRLGIKMLRIIQHIHRHGYVHCDIKPGNFLLRPDCLHFLVLVDFGLMRRYIDSETKTHIEMEYDIGFNGTLKYCSPNSMVGNTLSRRDDLYSWIYSLYELKNGHLPWEGEKKDEMMRLKLQFSKSSYFNTLPIELQEIHQYISLLNFDEEPNYDWIIDSILKAMNRKKINTTDPFDWEKLSCNHILSFSPIAELPKATWCRVENPNPILSRPGQPNYSRIRNKLCHLCCVCYYT